MASCEKCWDDAGTRSRECGKSKVECYNELLVERKDNPCTQKEQAGQVWDEEKQIDRRMKGKCPKCGREYYGWNLQQLDKQHCACGAKLVITRIGKKENKRGNNG